MSRWNPQVCVCGHRWKKHVFKGGCTECKCKEYRAKPKQREWLNRPILLCALLLAGCGGGMQAINQLPPPPPVLPQIDGTYVITLDGFILLNGMPKPAFTFTIKQDAWSGDAANLEVSGSGNSSFCAAPGTQWSVDGSLTKADTLTITVSNTMQPLQTVLTLSSADFSTLAGKWTPGPAMVSCNGFDSTGTDFTWKAVKQ